LVEEEKKNIDKKERKGIVISCCGARKNL